MFVSIVNKDFIIIIIIIIIITLGKWIFQSNNCLLLE